MLRRRANKPGGGGTGEQHKIFVFDHGRAAAVISPPLAAPPAMLLVDSSPELAEAVVMSPTSILQTAAAASPTSPAAACGGNGTGVPFSRTGGGGGGSGDRRSKSHRPWDEKPVGLGLVGALNGEGAHDDIVACASAVLAGQKLLRVQPTSLAPCSPPSTELGVKNKSSRSGAAASPPAHAAPPVQPRHASPRRRGRGCLSPREMEMSEDYTRVIARGPNPRTTHIFDNRVVETCGGSWFSSERAAAAGASGGGDGDDFLRRCHGCGKDLGQGKDIFMYRGERAFCSRECRHREMAFDDGMEEF